MKYFNSIYKKKIGAWMNGLNLPRKPNIWILFFIAWVSVYTLGYAQIQKINNIDEAIKLAIENNGIIRANIYNEDASKSLLKSAYTMPKLNVNAQLGQYNSIKFDNGFQISQSIPFPTVFGAKRKLIEQEIIGREWQTQISINELKNQVRKYYYQILYLHHNKGVLQNLDSLYTEYLQIANLRFKTGDIKKSEIHLAEIQRGQIQVLLAQNQVDVDEATLSFNTLLNTKENIIIEFSGKYEPLVINDPVDLNAISNHPFLQEMHQQIKILDHSKKLEKAEGLPEFSLGYTNQSLIGYQTIDDHETYFGPGKRFNAFSIGTAIPITYGATKAKMASLDNQKKAVEQSALQNQNMLSAQLKNEINQYHQNVKQYQYYKTKALPDVAEIVHGAHLGYRTGDISYLEYLYALQMATEIQLKYLTVIQEINSTVTNINSLINK